MDEYRRLASVYAEVPTRAPRRPDTTESLLNLALLRNRATSRTYLDLQRRVYGKPRAWNDALLHGVVRTPDGRQVYVPSTRMIRTLTTMANGRSWSGAGQVPKDGDRRVRKVMMAQLMGLH